MLKKEILLENKELIKELYVDKNYTKKQLAEKFNCSTSVLERFLKEQEISKRKRILLEDLPSKSAVQELIDQGLKYSEVCDKFGINNTQLSKILEIGKFSNAINDELLEDNSPLLWYLLGIISSDGHNEKFNTVDIFQKDGTYLNGLKDLLEHKGTLYKNGDGYTLKINSKKLSNILNNYNVCEDKRYSVPYMKAPTLELESCYIRGLFDGDGCIYFNYVSGTLKNKRLEITTGSKLMAEGIEDLYKRLNLVYEISERTSEVGNTYYVIYVRKIEEIIKLGKWIYSNKSLKFKLIQKYIKFLKFIGILNLNKKVEDIVGAD